jgi:hypothetical protein
MISEYFSSEIPSLKKPLTTSASSKWSVLMKTNVNKIYNPVWIWEWNHWH